MGSSHQVWLRFQVGKHSGRGIKYKPVSSQNCIEAFGEHREHVKFNLLDELLRWVLWRRRCRCTRCDSCIKLFCPRRLHCKFYFYHYAIPVGVWCSYHPWTSRCCHIILSSLNINHWTNDMDVGHWDVCPRLLGPREPRWSDSPGPPPCPGPYPRRWSGDAYLAF